MHVDCFGHLLDETLGRIGLALEFRLARSLQLVS
jgi:hypothetical protein